MRKATALLVGLPVAGLLVSFMATSALTQPVRTALCGHRGDPRVPIDSLPFTITQCGSYYLTGCLLGQSGSDGITIDADHVTLDLNGFSLLGVPGALVGINVPGAHTNIRVENGTVAQWAKGGISAGSAVASSFDEVRIVGNGTNGVEGHGLVVGEGCVVSACLVADSGLDGIQIGSFTTVRATMSYHNGADGLRIQPFSNSSAILDSHFGLNGSAGIRMTTANLLVHAQLRSNGLVGEQGPSCVYQCCIP